MIIEIIDIAAIILLRVSLLLMTWSSVNILFYLFRYYYYYFFVVHAACRTTRSVPMKAELGFSRSLRGKGKTIIGRVMSSPTAFENFAEHLFSLFFFSSRSHRSSVHASPSPTIEEEINRVERKRSLFTTRQVRRMRSPLLT